MKLSLVVPCFNEEENVGPFFEACKRALDEIESYEVIFINDGSRDSTWKELRRLKKLIGSIPVMVILFVNIIGKDNFIHYNFVLPELLPLRERIWNIVPLLLSVVVLVCIFYTVCVSVSKNSNKWLLLLLLVLAAGSREMMGFSTTIYASNYRTFTFFLYALIVCCLILLEELCSDNENGLWHAGTAAIAMALIVSV